MQAIPRDWRRRKEPILSADTPGRRWPRVNLYSPHVIHHDGKYRLWFIGNSTETRKGDTALGYAESVDGIHFHEPAPNPIATPDALPFGDCWQTVHVIFDREESIYKMWFAAKSDIQRDEKGKVVDLHTALAYATSDDGIHWRVHAEPLYDTARRPCVIKVAPNHYRMWMNARPSPEAPWDELYKNIYAFTSSDGLHWQRAATPCITPAGPTQSCVYPFVVRAGDEYVMWFGCHMSEGGRFEIHLATSADGSTWQPHYDAPAFAATGDQEDFDGRYTSTPCVLDDGDRWLLYYSARDWRNEYIGGDGKTYRDNSGRYAHIGVAVCPKTDKKQ